ncbi:MAG TPA: hypothetical protein VLI06_11060 [Solimonas sp.]|nr:hypothetical protein [Solimonas sp.]
MTRIHIGLMIVATLLLLFAADRYFDPAPPQICLDGGCYAVE